MFSFERTKKVKLASVILTVIAFAVSLFQFVKGGNEFIFYAGLFSGAVFLVITLVIRAVQKDAEENLMHLYDLLR